MLAFATNLENDLNIVTVNIAAGHVDKILHSGGERVMVRIRIRVGIRFMVRFRVMVRIRAIVKF